jgi:excisionase family DNA binding protein
MMMKNNISPQVLSAATAMLQVYVPELSPYSLVAALKTYDVEGSNKKTDNKPLTRQEAAALLSVSLNTINNYLSNGTLSKIRLGKRLVRVDAKSVQELLAGDSKEKTEVQNG